MSYIPSNSRMGQATLDFGYAGGGEGDTATVTVPATWANQNSVIICQVGSLATADHDPEDAGIEQITARALNIVSGEGFDIQAGAAEGTFGQYIVMYQGLISRNPT